MLPFTIIVQQPPDNWYDYLKDMQTLVTGILAAIAVAVGWRVTARQAERQREEEREHTRRATRAGLCGELNVLRMEFEYQLEWLEDPEEELDQVVFVGPKLFSSLLPNLVLLDEGEIGSAVGIYGVAEATRKDLMQKGRLIRDPKTSQAQKDILIGKVRDRINGLLTSIDNVVNILNGQPNAAAHQAPVP